ncbi:GAF domain-containing protein [Haloterrigena sp. H1]|uniref:sensor histidine kinase n=1 Tax=Haloterrigena sp. H1 TaxID=2552943 RepID=UPI00110F24E8|nr:GAF domain-containing sensor histidine kinase [Haloterrigena sp. H1]TMT86715.1 GAF domain-containing protein [Haloterrigena sp. H1]
MTQSLLESDEPISNLCDLMDRELPATTIAEQAMEIGASYLGLENGHLTNIATETDHWEIIASTDPSDGSFPVGRVADLQTTFCRHTFQRDGPLELHDIRSQGWEDDIAFETHELGCYLGVPITVDGDQYGTLCFVSESARAEPFSETERQFVELLVRMVECKLERQQYDFAYTRGNKLIDLFSRILRHNLRNNMTVVRGRIEMLTDQLEDPRFDQEDLTAPIDELLTLTEKAREVDTVVRTEFGMENISMVSLLRNAIAELEDTYPAATFSLDAPADATVFALPTIETALYELLENAAKHAGDDPTCIASVKTETERILITISDDGPGLSDQERRVFQNAEETPLVHGSGLGLWMVDWIIRSHSGTVEVSVTERGTSLTVSIPRPLAGKDPLTKPQSGSY